MENCIFCKIINKEIPSYTIYEDDQVIAFLDISQSTHGHTLVVSKQHYENLLTIPSNVLERIITIAQKISIAMYKVLPNIKGINLLNNCDEVAGQVIKHFHLHIIPRYTFDDYNIRPVKNNETSKEVFNNIVNIIKEVL